MADIQIFDERAGTFADALQTFEKHGDVAAFAALFADDAVTQRLDARATRSPPSTTSEKDVLIEVNWSRYSFQNCSTSPRRAALEWTSAATLTDGRPLQYRGVTVLDLDGDKISKLRTYYDSAQVTPATAATRR